MGSEMCIRDRKRALDMKKDLPMVRFCVKVAWYQMEKRRLFVLENPDMSLLWSVPEVMDLFDAPWGNSGVNYDVVDPLLFGEKTAEKPGTRGTALMHNFLDGQLTPLFHRVTNKDHKPELQSSYIPHRGTDIPKILLQKSCQAFRCAS